jgi:hypothetical protein
MCSLKEFARSAANGLVVLESLYARPILGVKEVIELTGMSFGSRSAYGSG